MSNARYSLMGPSILIVIGTLFLIHQFRPEFGIGRLWPVILIVIGVVRLLESGGGQGSDLPAAPGGTSGTNQPSTTSGSEHTGG